MSDVSSQVQPTWNLNDLFTSDTDPLMAQRRKEIGEKTCAFARKWKERTDYLEVPSVLREALDEYEQWSRTDGFAAGEAYYFSLRFAQDQTDPAIKAKMNLAEEFGKKLQNEIRFFEHSIAMIPEERQKKLLEAEELKPYRHFLEMTFAKAKYLLTEPEEKILSMLGTTSYGNWIDMVEGFLNREEREVLDHDGKLVRKPFNEIFSLLKSRQKEVRDSAATGINSVLAQYADVAEAEINSVINFRKTVDQLRNVDRPDRTRHIADDMDTEVVDAALAAVERRFQIAHRYYALKAKLIGVDRLAYHERNVEVGEVHGSYTWDDSKALIRKVFGRLDDEFLAVFNAFESEGRFDVFPRKGKAGGAFCAHYLITYPTYILLNHTNQLYDVLVIAHEVGHGINNELIKKKQNSLHFGTPASTAEVASTFMEDFVFDELLHSADEETRLALLMLKMDEEISTIFRQVACYRFEQALHERIRSEGYLSKEDIGKLFQENMAAYMGPSVEQSPGSENWWIYWSHIRKFFYVYSYATGLLISKSLQARVKADANEIGKVKEFLAAGRSASPKDIFAAMGIDITKASFWDAGLQKVEDELEKADELAKQLGKI
ncbi:MAG: M3 family oligoendopeptidase [Patescibacteria group bacterium]|nr:M3 family oligoendopeptidase [Patescibacteria group bacterium]